MCPLAGACGPCLCWRRARLCTCQQGRVTRARAGGGQGRAYQQGRVIYACAGCWRRARPRAHQQGRVIHAVLEEAEAVPISRGVWSVPVLEKGEAAHLSAGACDLCPC